MRGWRFACAAGMRRLRNDRLIVGQSCWRAARARPYRETLRLRDGRTAWLRLAHHSDADALQRFFSALSPRSRLLRFHGAVNRVPEDVLDSLTTQVPHRHLALVALTDTDDGIRHLLAEARYAVDGDGRAEFAVAVADAWQGQRLGRALLQRLAIPRVMSATFQEENGPRCLALDVGVTVYCP